MNSVISWVSMIYTHQETTSKQGDIALYPDAETLAKDDFMAELFKVMQEEMKKQFGELFEMEIFVMPGDTTFAKVKGFYNDQLTGEGWTVAQEQSKPDSEMIIWQKGLKAFGIMYMADPLHRDQTYLIVLQTKN